MEKELRVIDRLASSLNRRDEEQNIELAEEIVRSKNKEAIEELIENLANKKAIQNDAIKVLYEIGARNSDLIADYVNEFVEHLSSKNNRLRWGAMTALSTITSNRPKEIYASLPKILAVADQGSVITKDQAVNVLIKLCETREYAKSAEALLIEQLLKSATNQLPMYAERIMPVVNDNNRGHFIEVLTARLSDIEKESKRKRVEKVIKKITK